MVWVEPRRRRDQVRRCCHRSRLNVNISSGPWGKASQKHRSASRSWLKARSSRQMYTRHHVCPPNLLVPARYPDMEGVRPSSSLYFVGFASENLFYSDRYHTRATIPLRPPTQTDKRQHGISIRQATPEKGSVSPAGITVPGHRWPRVPWAHLLFYIQLLRHPPLKTFVDKRLLWRRTRSLKHCRREWRRVGIVEHGKRRGLGSDSLRDIVQRRGASDVPPRARAQNAALGGPSECAHRVSVQDQGVLDRSST